MIVAGLGVLNDVTITQSSSVWELREAAPHLTRRQLFASGMRIGRDHIASTIYTIVFAYAGTAVATMLLISLYDRPLIDVLSDEAIAEEVARTPGLGHRPGACGASDDRDRGRDRGTSRQGRASRKRVTGT
ncbi:YibE/F family protein [Nocardioides sp. B-3]|uniref:YibE/F family protein n=1 Tax=Nocardioides sp. B-3 TaxID=2895565 RepID=UPI0021522A9E|nr:YibE/F family protein [Nocardioides sp. B-3]